jgi:hypothetical protein
MEEIHCSAETNIVRELEVKWTCAPNKDMENESSTEQSV